MHSSQAELLHRPDFQIRNRKEKKSNKKNQLKNKKIRKNFNSFFFLQFGERLQTQLD